MSDAHIAVKYGDLQWSWREYLAEAAARAAALIGAADPQRPMHIGALLGNNPEMCAQMAAAGLGGYVLCGLNTTRRGEALAADIRRADCQFVVTDAEHRPLLDGLDLGGTQILDASTPQWAEFLAAAGELVPHREVDGHGRRHDDLHLRHQRKSEGGSGLAPDGDVRRHQPASSASPCRERSTPVTCPCRCFIPMPSSPGGRAVCVGGAPRLVPAKFSATNFLDDVRHYGATYMNYVGKPWRYILATPERPRRRGQSAAGGIRQRGQRQGTSRRSGAGSASRVEDGFGSSGERGHRHPRGRHPEGVDRQGD